VTGLEGEGWVLRERKIGGEKLVVAMGVRKSLASEEEQRKREKH
jgi:hypothetical protein